MTTGTRTANGLVITGFANCGYPPYTLTHNCQWGPYRQKTWAGGDTPKATRDAKIPAAPSGWSKPKPFTREYVKTYRRKDGKVITVYTRPPKRPMRDKTPKERKQRMKPQYTPHDYTMDYVERFDCPILRTDSDAWQTVVNIAKGNSWTNEPVDPREHYALIAKLKRKAYGSGWNPAVFAVEMPQALRMIGSAATRLRLALIATMRGNWRGVVRNLGLENTALYGRARTSWLSYREGRLSLSGFWLEVAYGWKPLVGDLESAAQYIGWAVGNSSGFKPTTLRARREWRTFKRIKPELGFVHFTERSTVWRAQYVIRDVEASAPGSLPALTSVATAAWEKLPWSFVIDWAVPISSYLEALRTAAIIRGTVVFTISKEVVYTVPRAGAGIKRYAVLAGTPFLREYTLTRTVTSEIKPPSPLPDLSPGSVFNDWHRAANAVALLAQVKSSTWAKLGSRS